MPFDFRTPDQWTAPSHAHAVHANPIPVPSECIDFTPPELWAVIWKHYPQGTEMPASVPRHVWVRMELSGPTPVFWRCHWGKFGENAMSNKGAQPAKHYVKQPVLSDAFWDDYFKLFPVGHKSPN
jgi:hypothetical protein